MLKFVVMGKWRLSSVDLLYNFGLIISKNEGWNALGNTAEAIAIILNVISGLIHLYTTNIATLTR